MPSHTLTLVRRRLTLVLFRTLLRARGTTHRSARQPHKHTSAHEWWHCQRLLCSTLFAVSFEGPTLPILSTPPPPIASSHLLMFFDTLEQLTPSFRSFFFPSICPSLSLFQHECVYSRPCHDNFHPHEEDYPILIVYLLHLVLLNTQKTRKKITGLPAHWSF